MVRLTAVLAAGWALVLATTAPGRGLAAAELVPPGAVMASGRGFTITKEELDAMARHREALLHLQAGGVSENSRESFRGGCLDVLIARRVCAAHATDADRTRAKRALEEAVGKMRAESVTEEGFLDRLARVGFSLAGFRSDAYEEALARAVAEREIGAQFEVSAEEIAKYYDGHAGEFVTDESARVLQLLISNRDLSTGEELPPEQRNERLRFAQELRRRAASGGEDFRMLIRKYNEESSARGASGEMTVLHGHAVLEVERAAFELEPGVLSDVLSSPMGFHVIQVLDRKKAEQRPLADVTDLVRSKLLSQQIAKRLPDYLAGLRKELDVRLGEGAPRPVWAIAEAALPELPKP